MKKEIVWYELKLDDSKTDEGCIQVDKNKVEAMSDKDDIWWALRIVIQQISKGN